MKRQARLFPFMALALMGWSISDSVRASQRKYRQSPKGKAYKKKSHAAYQKRRRDALAEIKMQKGCSDCGYNSHPAALDFDHLPGTIKLFSVGGEGGSGKYPWPLVLAEIEKCEVVCANCHRVRTAERGVTGLAKAESGSIAPFIALIATLGLFSLTTVGFVNASVTHTTTPAAPASASVSSDQSTTDASQNERMVRKWILAVSAHQAGDQAAAQQAAQAAAAQAAAQAAADQARYAQSHSPSSTGSVTMPVSTGSGGNDAIWACIIKHESGGDPTAMNPSGAAGLYQFMPGTWHTASGLGGSAADYPASVQTQAAYSYQARYGWSAWIGDGCTPLG